MRALRLVEQGCPGRYELGEVPDPVAGPGEAVVRVRACGLNRIDVWLEEGALPMPIRLPRVPGCEIAGEVLELGSGSEGWVLGERVAVQSNLFCGECEYCQRGEESVCLRGELLGVQRDGGLAERVVVPARSLVRMPAGVDFVSSAALTLAGSTAMHMVTDRAQVRSGDWVLVMGAASGVGSVAIQIVRHLGGRVITTGTTAGREVALNLWPLFVKQQRLVGSYGRSRRDMEAVLAGAAAGWLRPLVDRVLGLAQAEEGLAALRERRVLGKVVIAC